MDQTSGKCTAGDSKTTSIDDIMDKASGDLAMATIRKEHLAALTAFLQKANAGADEYTVPKRIELIKRWRQQDTHIAELIEFLKEQPKWDQGIKQVCALYRVIELAQGSLDGAEEFPGAFTDAAAKTQPGLYRTRAMQQEQRDRARRDYESARLVLTAWEKPAQALDKILTDNAKLIADTLKAKELPPQPTLAFDVFIKLVPLHLAIKPPDTAEPKVKRLDRHGVDGLTDCAKAADAAIAPQPSLIPPANYLSKQCAKVLGCFGQAMEMLAAAEGNLKISEDAIDRYRKQIEAKKKSFDKDARAALLAAAVAPETAATAAQPLTA